MAGTELERLVVRIEGDLSGLRASLSAGEATLNKASAAMSQSMLKVGTAMDAVNFAGRSLSGALTLMASGGLIAAARAGFQFSGQLSDLAAQAGVSTEMIQQMRYAGMQLGLSTQQSDGLLLKLGQSMGEASIEGGKALDKFEALGISLEELRGMNVEQTFFRTIDALSKVESETERARRAFELFGADAGPRLAQVIAAGSNGLRELGEQGKKTGAIISDELIKKGEEANQKMEVLSATLTANLNQAFIGVAPAIVTATELLGKFAIGLSQAFMPDYSMLGQYAEQITALEKKLASLQKQADSGLLLFVPDNLTRRIEETKKQLESFRQMEREALNGRGFKPPAAAPAANLPATGTGGALTQEQQRLAAERERQMQDTRKRMQQFYADTRADGIQHFNDMLSDEEKATEASARQMANLSRIVEQAKAQSLRFREQLAATTAGDFFAGREGVSAEDAGGALSQQQALQLQQEQMFYEQQRDQLSASLAELNLIRLESGEMESAQSLEQRDALYAALLQAETDHQIAVGDIKRTASEAQAKLDAYDAQRKMALTQSFFSDLSSLMTTKNKRLFEIGKIAAVSASVIGTFNEARAAFDEGSQYNYYAGVAMAAAATIKGAIRTATIASTSYGSGSVPASGGGVSRPSGAEGNGNAQPRTLINIQGDADTRFSPGQIRKLLQGINEQIGDGTRLVVAGGDF